MARMVTADGWARDWFTLAPTYRTRAWLTRKFNQAMAQHMQWKQPSELKITRGRMYLVKTNGAEWRDNNLHLWPAPMVELALKWDIIRGEVLWIAEVTEPENTDNDTESRHGI